MRCTNRSVVHARQPTLLHLPKHLCSLSGIIIAHSPSGYETCLPAQFTNGSCFVEFVPDEIGEWFLTTSSPVSSPTSLSSSPTSSSSSPPPTLPSASPFKTKVFDPVGICVILPLHHVVGSLVPFIVDATQAQDTRRLKVRVESNRRQMSTEVKETWGLLQGSFCAMEPCEAHLHVEYAGQPVIGSPFKVIIHPQTLVNLEMKKPLTRVNRSCKVDLTFNRPLKDEDEDDVVVVVSNPHSRERSISIVPHTPDNTFNNRIIYSFVPTTVGKHQLEASYKGVLLPSPVVCSAYDPAEVRVVYVQQEADEECIFDVDTGKAGEGLLEVMIDEGRTEYKIKEVGRGLYRITLPVKDQSSHKVDLFFNSEPVPGCPFTMKMKKDGKKINNIKPPQLSFTTPTHPSNAGEQVIYSQINQKSTFKIAGPCKDLYNISIDIIETASGKRIKARLGHLNPDYDNNETTVTFVTQQIGDHTGEILYNGTKMGDVPFKIKSFDVSKVKVDVVQDGKGGHFVVDAKGAGEGAMMFLLEEDGKKLKAKCDVEVLSNGTFQINPVLPGSYGLHVFLNQKPVPGSPFPLKSIEDTPKSKKKVRFDLRSDLHLNQRSCIDLRIPDISDDGTVYIDVTDDKGKRIPHVITKKFPSLYSIELTPDRVGKVRVRVKKEGWQDVVLETPVGGFEDDVVRGKEPLIDSKYGFQPPALPLDHINNTLLQRREPLQVNKKATIDLRLPTPSQHDDVHIDVTDDKGRRIPHVITKKFPSLYSIELTPDRVGEVRVRVKKEGWQDVVLEVPVHEGDAVINGACKPVEAKCSGEGLERGVVGEASSFVVDTGNKRRKDLVVQVEGPNSVSRVLMEAISRSAYKVTYIPKEVGRFAVMVRCDGSHVAGSPFEAHIFDPTKVTYVGGFESWVDPVSKVLTLHLGQATKIELTCKNAGPGSISGELLYSNGVVELLEVYEDGDFTIVVIVPVFEGNHLVQISLGGRMIPHSPIRAVVQSRNTSASSNASRVYVCGRGLKEAVINQKAFFIIDATRAGSGEAKVNLIGSKGNENVLITAVKHTTTGSLYKGEYIVPQLGSYFLEIKWCNREVRGSPYKVIALQGTQASKVECGGDGLKKGLVEVDNEVIIDCRQTDAIGNIEVECKGKTEDATCRLVKHSSQTYLLYYKPTQAGKHHLHIKYDGHHVPGSPFEVRVSKLADASKVKVFGPGVERRSKLDGFKGVFFADTSGAGVGQLVVRVKGPKGSFCVEMHKLQHRLVACRYDPLQAGDYLVQVKWSGSEVKGSPFKVKLVN